MDTTDIQSQRDDDGLYTVQAERKVQISQMTCPTTIRCTLSLLDTNYTRRVEAIFYGEFLSGEPTTKYLHFNKFQILISRMLILIHCVSLLNFLVG